MTCESTKICSFWDSIKNRLLIHFCLGFQDLSFYYCLLRTCPLFFLVGQDSQKECCRMSSPYQLTWNDLTWVSTLIYSTFLEYLLEVKYHNWHFLKWRRYSILIMGRHTWNELITHQIINTIIDRWTITKRMNRGKAAAGKRPGRLHRRCSLSLGWYNE